MMAGEEMGFFAAKNRQKNKEVLEDYPVLLPLSRPQIPYGMAWN